MSGLGGNGGHHEHHGPAAGSAAGVGVGSAAAAAAASTGFPGHVTAALGIHPHHFALIETAFNNAAGLRQLAGLQHHQQHAQQQQQQQHQPQQLQHHQQVWKLTTCFLLVHGSLIFGFVQSEKGSGAL